MKKLIIALSVFVLFGCGEPHEYTRNKNILTCPEESIDIRAEFILQCIENANPKSDEEPEDWLYICKNMSKDLYCKAVLHEVTYYSQDGREGTFTDIEISRKIIK